MRRTGDEDEGLRDDSNLEIDDHMNDWVVWILGGAPGARQGNTEIVFEEIGLEDDDEESNPMKESVRAP